MVYIIQNFCTNCCGCDGECKFDALKEVDYEHKIDSEKCNGCGKCAEWCPIGAIIPQE
jgi:heterodisulfide reductase subunit A-like polyferredoxin